MQILFFPFRMVGWVLMTMLTTVVRTVAVLATIGLILAAVYWFGVQGAT